MSRTHLHQDSVHIFSWRGARRILALLGALFLVYQLWIAGQIVWWIHHNPGMTAVMTERLTEMRRSHPNAVIHQQWIPYNRVSINLKRALVAAEDAKFLEHDGFDWEGMQEAMQKDLKRGRIVAGGSTISQQLAKNLFLSSSRTPWRKAEEAIITVMLEQILGKKRILEIYLNVIEWGDGIFGAEAAARHYYHTSAANLGAEQAARLAAMVPNPRWYDKHRASRGLARKTAIILARMPYARVPSGRH